MSPPVAPHDLDAERAVLGAVLLQPAHGITVEAILETRDFYRTAHQQIFAAMQRLAERGAGLDLITLKDALHTSGELEDIGGPAYIASLADGVPRSVNVEHYARIVKEKATLRRMIDVGKQLTTSAYGGTIDGFALQQADALLAAASASPIPPLTRLDAWLEAPEAPIAWRVTGLQPAQSRVVLSAQFKAGKTSFVSGYVRALADEEPVLDAFAVMPGAGAIVVLDFEMARRQLRQWYGDSDIQRRDRVIVLPMRGHVADFNILDRGVRRQWADRLRAVQASDLVIDCFRPLLDAFALDEHRDAGRMLVAIDALLAEAEIPNALLVHHMGHQGERSRGDSRIRDWPDVEWQLVRKTPEASSPRFFRAYGRDVDVPEGQLSWNAETRRMALVGGSRRDSTLDGVLVDIVDALRGGPMSGRAIKAALRDQHPRDVIDDALHRGQGNGALRVERGPKRALLYQVSEVSGECPADGETECPGSLIESRTRTHTPRLVSVR